MEYTLEYIDVVDENNELTGQVASKNDVHSIGYWYREVVGFVVNENKEILLQKRASTKKDKPNMWEICFGHVSSGENPQVAIIRELGEELGLEVDETKLQVLGIEKTQEINKYNNTFHYAFSYVYLIRANKKLNEFKMQKEEVSDIKYISIDELENMIYNKDKELAFGEFEYILKMINKIKEII